jgi:4-amino-4-deoxy-L-arabinose transferase-like glycosyltransferase
VRSMRAPNIPFMPGSDSPTRDLRWLAAICALAFALRAVVIANMLDAKLFADMQEYHDRAMHLLKTGTLFPDAFRVPLYPMFIAGVFKVFGPNLLAVRLAQALLGTCTVGLTYFLGRRDVASRAALAAAFVVATYPALLLYSAYLMAETLFSFFVVLTLVLWLKRRAWAAAAAGVVLGAATLTRSVGLALIGGIVIAEVWRAVMRRETIDRAAMTRLAALVAGVALAMMPWVTRNYGIYHRFLPTDTSSGFNVLIGNYPGASGRHPGIAAVEGVMRNYWSTARNDLERSDIGMRAGRAFVLEHPARAARLALLKVAYLIGVEGREHAWGYSYHVQGKHNPTTVRMWGIAIIVSFPLLFLAALIGFSRPGALTTDAGVLIVATLACAVAVHVASFGDTRFHLPWIPLLAVFAARAVAVVPGNARLTWPRKAALFVGVVVLTAMWGSQLPELLTVLPRLAESEVPLQLPY